MTSDHVLNELNRFRAEHFDLEPLEEMPKGKQGSPCECPVANSLPPGWNTSVSTAYRRYWSGPEDSHLLPWAVNRFVYEFDEGLYPELIER